MPFETTALNTVHSKPEISNPPCTSNGGNTSIKNSITVAVVQLSHLRAPQNPSAPRAVWRQGAAWHSPVPGGWEISTTLGLSPKQKAKGSPCWLYRVWGVCCACVFYRAEGFMTLIIFAVSGIAAQPWPGQGAAARPETSARPLGTLSNFHASLHQLTGAPKTLQISWAIGFAHCFPWRLGICSWGYTNLLFSTLPPLGSESSFPGNCSSAAASEVLLSPRDSL